ncbi:MAG: AraC family transcriptional regulator [Alteromonas sp.]|nr:AraC family transcriptional regulator [Alteromonas sp.]MAY23921.1 AraC family transcriptional regulator [Flavobacteriaceae bacterium]|tara:strand:- start:21102 stop:21968 length:867 start_codon:yes stop_codon:yes gene_type:complete
MNRSVSTYNNELKLKGFNVFQIEDDSNATRVYSRKDFYKICLTTGKSKIHYSDRSFDANGTILFFGNPNVPYSWETLSTQYVGYTVLFSEDFLLPSKRSDQLQKSLLFKMGGTPILEISEAQRQFLNSIFQKMMEEQQSEYEHKDEVIRNYIELILHESLKLKPSENYRQDKNGAERLTTVFMELLERQFPVESPESPLKLKTAKDYANHLSVHVNYLNRSVKSVTGKTTTAHISERIAQEAKAILQHTHWNVSEIAYALGFDYPTYFNNFFKKQMGKSPSAVRLQKV